MTDTELLQRLHRIEDVLLPEHPDVRPVRRAIDLFRFSCSPKEWEAFTQYHRDQAKETFKGYGEQKTLQMLAMVLDYRPALTLTYQDLEKGGSPKQPYILDTTLPPAVPNTSGTPTVKSRQTYTTKFRTFVMWLAFEAPDWYKDLIKLYLELWSLESKKSMLRKAYMAFNTECWSSLQDWQHHRNAKSRIEDLQKRINKIAVPCPKHRLTEHEKALLCSIKVPGTIVSLIPKETLPPYIDKLAPLPTTRKLDSTRELTEIERKVEDFITKLIPDMPMRDILAWPFLPFTIPILVGDKVRRVMLTFRSNGKSSCLPRFLYAWGPLNVMVLVNETAADSENTRYLGELSWSQDRVIIFDAEQPSLVRVWVNRIRVTKEEGTGDLPFTKCYYLVNREMVKLSISEYDGMKGHYKASEEGRSKGCSPLSATSATEEARQAEIVSPRAKRAPVQITPEELDASLESLG